MHFLHCAELEAGDQVNDFEESKELPSKTYSWNENLTSLRRWRISSFKSIKNESEIELAPLTVVVGANSSGKSSLIQSILLVAQNASSSLRTDTSQGQGFFELNSFLVQLGVLKEVICDLWGKNEAQKSFDIGGLWYLGDERETGYYQLRPSKSWLVKPKDESSVFKRGENYLDWGVKFDSKRGSLESGVVRVDSSFAITVQDGIRYQVAQAKRFKAAAELNILSGKYDEFSFSHRSTVMPHAEFLAIKGSSELSRPNQNHEERNTLVNFRAGLPISGMKLIGIVDYIFGYQNSLLKYAPYEFLEESNLEDAEPEGRYEEYIKKELNSSNIEFTTLADAISGLVLAIAEVAQKILQQDKVGDDLSVATLAQSIESRPLIPFASIPFDYKRIFSEDEKEIDDFLSSARKLFNEIYSNSEWVHSKILCSLDGRRMIQPILGKSITSTVIEKWNRFLSDSIVYLGPLRASPKATYGLGSGIENANIPLGESGEFTAKKLFNEKNLKRYPVPDNGIIVDRRITLEEAVSLWYQELCIAPEVTDKIEVQAPGRQGYLLNIGSRTLANVGFGVSQILPVITLCLITAPGSLILLEQPELHLNPGMQQKLADFLLEMVKTGRQIIVETHSEYLITRLRRRAATIENDHSYFGIIFAERDEKEGTSYRTVNVNESGDLSEWPKGFFDHVSEDLRVLMRKAAEKQAKRALPEINED